MFVLNRISDAHGQHLFHQQLAHFKLAGAAWILTAIFDRGSINLYVLEEPVQKSLAIHGLRPLSV